MTSLQTVAKSTTSHAGRTMWTAAAIVASATAAYLLFDNRDQPSDTESSAQGAAIELPTLPPGVLPDRPSLLAPMPKERLATLRVDTETARRASWPRRIRVTGRMELNRSRIAHIRSLVDGVARE
jgi:hypothetical protein